MAISKIILNGVTQMDVTGNTNTAARMFDGDVGTAADGTAITGTYTPSASVDVEPLSVTANGTYTAPTGTAYSPVTVNVSGGGSTTAEKSDVNFYDYDGTILYSYTATEAAALTELPANPSRSGLTAQGWNYTLAQIQTEVTAQGKCDIGQMYVTSDDKTRIYCHFETGRLSPYLGICPNGTVVVDWGDNSATDTLTGTSLTTAKTVQHTYASAGDYTITLTASSGTFAFYGASNASYILTKDGTTTASVSRVYAAAIRKIELGSAARIGNYGFSYCANMESITIHSACTIGTYAFQYCYNLSSITIPSGVTSIGTYVFRACYNLSSITIPSGVTSIGTYTFSTCHSLASITIPSGVTSIGNYVFNSCSNLSSITIPSGVTSISTYAFQNCHSLASITIPSGVTSISTYAFQYCYSLASITIPSGVTSISTYALASCYGVAEYHLLPTTPPTLANTNAFNGIVSDCVIYVPVGTLTDYQAATNWSTYADYMQEEPQ